MRVQHERNGSYGRQFRGSIHQISSDEVFQRRATDPRGLSAAEVVARLQRFGPNVLREAQRTPLLPKLLANFTHLMALLLWAGGVMAFLAQMAQLAIAIWAVNLINGTFSFWQERKAEQATAALRRLLPSYARVLRDGAEQQVPSETLVPGDLLLLNEGDHISADARLIAAADLQVDQSTLTGESRPVRKTSNVYNHNAIGHIEQPTLVFAGTNVVSGSGQAIVFATGMDTEFGTIADLTQRVRDVGARCNAKWRTSPARLRCWRSASAHRSLRSPRLSRTSVLPKALSSRWA